jgi:ribosomal protein S13
MPAMQLDTEVLIAIIVGAVGAVLGLLALLIALTTRIAGNKALRFAESVQHSIGHASSADWLKDRELEETLKVRTVAVETIQKLKRELERAVFATAGSTKCEKVLQGVSDAGRNVLTAQADLQNKLDEREQVAMKRAKEVALEASSRVRSGLESIDDPSQLGDRDRRAILLLRSELSEVQQVFRDRSAAHVVKRIFDRPAPES